MVDKKQTNKNCELKLINRKGIMNGARKEDGVTLFNLSFTFCRITPIFFQNFPLRGDLLSSPVNAGYDSVAGIGHRMWVDHIVGVWILVHPGIPPGTMKRGCPEFY